MEARIAALIEETINDLGFELVRVLLHDGRGKVLEVLIDGQDDKKVTISDCALVSRNISAILDVEDIISYKYFLEVSSAGIERPLVYFKDFQRFCGKDAKIRLKNPIDDKTNYKGKLLKAENDCITIESKGEEISIDFANIKSANLVLSDEMFRKLLKRK